MYCFYQLTLSIFLVYNQRCHKSFHPIIFHAIFLSRERLFFCFTWARASVKTTAKITNIISKSAACQTRFCDVGYFCPNRCKSRAHELKAYQSQSMRSIYTGLLFFLGILSEFRKKWKIDKILIFKYFDH